VAGVQCAACTADPDITLYSSDGKRTPGAPVPSGAANPALGAVRGRSGRFPAGPRNGADRVPARMTTVPAVLRPGSVSAGSAYPPLRRDAYLACPGLPYRASSVPWGASRKMW
jgi:hypothetical protein